MLIDDSATLENFIRAILQETEQGPTSYVAMDTEFVREKTYWPQLCLVQIATQKSSVIIDVLKVELALLIPLLQAPGIIKVFHSARQDLECFYHLLRVLPAPLFDTQIAATFIGLGEEISYEGLVRKLLDILIDKSLQYTNWAQRPLTVKQQAYALADVQHLYSIYPLMLHKLQKLHRETWALEDMNRLINPHLYEVNPAESWRRVRFPEAHGKMLPLIQDLAAWREAYAQEWNINRGRVLKDEVLVRLASKPPRTTEETLAIIENSTTNAVLLAPILHDLIQQSLHRPAHTWPCPISRKPKNCPNIGLLKLLQDQLAQEMNLPPSWLSTQNDLVKLCRGEEGGGCLTGWRYEVFGSKALSLLKGEAGLTINNGQLVLRKICS